MAANDVMSGVYQTDFAVRDSMHGIEDILKRAVAEGWGQAETQAAVYQSNFFQNAYPGYFGPDGTPNFSSPADYRQMYQEFRRTAESYGQQLPKAQFAKVVGRQIDIGEFEQRLNVVQTVKENPALFNEFRTELKAAGIKDLKEGDVFNFVAGKSSREYYDIYEAAQLRRAGLNISHNDALKLAKEILPSATGEGSGQQLSALIDEINRYKPDIAPELARMGITDADLIRWRAGTDPKKLAPKVAELLQQRRAQGAQVAGYSQNRTGAGTRALAGPVESGGPG